MMTHPQVLKLLVLEAAFCAFSAERFNVNCGMSIRFAGESGIDNGGPSREFIRLCMDESVQSQSFDWPEGNRELSLDANGKSLFR